MGIFFLPCIGWHGCYKTKNIVIKIIISNLYIWDHQLDVALTVHEHTSTYKYIYRQSIYQHSHSKMYTYYVHIELWVYMTMSWAGTVFLKWAVFLTFSINEAFPVSSVHTCVHTCNLLIIIGSISSKRIISVPYVLVQ